MTFQKGAIGKNEGFGKKPDPTEGNNIMVAEKPKEEKEGNQEPKAKMISVDELDGYLEKKKEEWRAEFKSEEKEKPKTYVGTKIESTDDLPELRDWEIKDRVYRLIGNEKTCSYQVQNRHKAKSPLQYRHPDTGQQYSLRYATNQTSYFESLQSKEPNSVTLGYITFTSLTYFVPKENTHLQKFLAIHPHNGTRFEEVNKVANAKKEMEALDLQFKAEQLVRGLEFLEQDAIAKLICKEYSEEWEPTIVRKELFAIIRTIDPKKIIALAEDKTLAVKGMAKTAVHRGYLKYSSTSLRFMDERDSVILEVHRNQNEWDAIATYLLSNEGNQLREHLEERIK